MIAIAGRTRYDWIRRSSRRMTISIFLKIFISSLCSRTSTRRWCGGEIEVDESYFGGKRKEQRGRGAAGVRRA